MMRCYVRRVDTWFTILRLLYLPTGPTGELFAQAPVKEYPGVAVETVSDSSRYFVLRIQDDNGEDEETYQNDYE